MVRKLVTWDPCRLNTEALCCVTITGLGFKVCVRSCVSLLTWAYISSSFTAIQPMSARVGMGGQAHPFDTGQACWAQDLKGSPRDLASGGTLVPVLLTTL